MDVVALLLALLPVVAGGMARSRHRGQPAAAMIRWAHNLGMQRENLRLLIVVLVFVALLAVWAWPDALSVSAAWNSDPTLVYSSK